MSKKHDNSVIAKSNDVITAVARNELLTAIAIADQNNFSATKEALEHLLKGLMMDQVKRNQADRNERQT